MVHTDHPWDGLGEDVSACPESKFVLHKAGLDWEVAIEPAFMLIEGPEGQALYAAAPNCQFTVRTDKSTSDVGRVLGQVSSSFTPAQNQDTFSLLDALLPNGLAFCRAGDFRQGRLVWMVAELRQGADYTLNGDAIRQFLVLRNAHDGNASMEILFCPVVHMTKTSVPLPMRAIRQCIRLRHTRTMGCRAVAEDILTAANAHMDSNFRLLKDLNLIFINDKKVTDILLALYPPSRSTRVDGLAIEARDQIHDAFLNFENRSGFSLWHAICAFIDHHRISCRTGSDPRETRMNAVLWGSRALKKSQLGNTFLKKLKIK